MNLPPPPAELAWLVEEIGVEKSLALIELRAGTRLYVARYFDPKMDLAAQLGAEAARALVRRWGGGEIKVPSCKRWRAAVYDAYGLSYPAIALKLGCDAYTVYRYLNPSKVPASQLKLALE